MVGNHYLKPTVIDIMESFSARIYTISVQLSNGTICRIAESASGHAGKPGAMTPGLMPV
jgi:hypothetical protein